MKTKYVGSVTYQVTFELEEETEEKFEKEINRLQDVLETSLLGHKVSIEYIRDQREKEVE